MDRFTAYALIGSAMDEVLANPTLLKHASTDPDAAVCDYLEKHAAAIKAEADAYCQTWIRGFQRKVAEAGLDKAALFGMEQTNPKLNMALEAARFGGYFVPGVGTVLMGADALGNFKDMASSGKTWKQRLGSGAMGLLNTGLAGLSLIPGGGIVGASLKAGRLAKLMGLFGAKGTALAGRAGNSLLNMTAKPLGGMIQGAISGQGMLGRGMRLAGAGPKAKTLFGGPNLFRRMQNLDMYLGNVQRLPMGQAGQYAQQVRQMGKLSPQMAAAVQGKVKAMPVPFRQSFNKNYAPFMQQNPTSSAVMMPGGKAMLGAVPVMVGTGMMAGGGPAQASRAIPWGPGHPQYEQSLRRAMG